MAHGQTVPPDEWRWAAPDLKERLQRDPIAVLKEYGLNVPAGLRADIVGDLVRIVFLLWVDGKIVPRQNFSIDPSDEGLLFGRGVWESTRTIGSIPWLWTLHIDRLRRTAALLDIEVAPERLPDSKQVSAYVRTLAATDVVVRLNVTAGRPGRSGMVWMSAAVPPFPSSSVRLQSRRSPDLKGQPYLAWKTFQYASRLRTGQQAAREGFDTALMIDAEDNILEAAHANIFVRLRDGWATPPADGGLLLPGTVRQHLLERAPVQIRERTIPRSLLGEAQEVFLTNSNLGIVPVVQIDEHSIPIGGETQALMRWLDSVSGSGDPSR